jgi:putative colanic acid biosynthesis UDP-glucose lipid carrier transferase
MNKPSSFIQLAGSEPDQSVWNEKITVTSPEVLSDPHWPLTNNLTLPDLEKSWSHGLPNLTFPEDAFYLTSGKRLVDLLIASLVTLLVLSWLMPLLGLFIILESSGPPFYIQKRSGRRGRSFHCLKLRTMRHQTQQAFQQTTRNDNRVTRLGGFLRRTNLDEMPQFLNVLLGDMSLVGPRPHAVTHDLLHWASPSYRARYIARPGITGLAQVRGARGATFTPQRMEHRVRYDHLYMTKQSFLLDVKICFRTVKLMFKGDQNAW